MSIEVEEVKEWPALLPDGLYRGSQLHARIDAAVAKERKRCLKIAVDLIIEEEFQVDCGTLNTIAKRIGATC